MATAATIIEKVAICINEPRGDYGLDIIVSPLIKDRAKLRFDPSFLGG